MGESEPRRKREAVLTVRVYLPPAQPLAATRESVTASRIPPVQVAIEMGGHDRVVAALSKQLSDFLESAQGQAALHARGASS